MDLDSYDPTRHFKNKITLLVLWFTRFINVTDLFILSTTLFNTLNIIHSPMCDLSMFRVPSFLVTRSLLRKPV